jgi:hypothetical protein
VWTNVLILRYGIYGSSYKVWVLILEFGLQFGLQFEVKF